VNQGKWYVKKKWYLDLAAHIVLPPAFLPAGQYLGNKSSLFRMYSRIMYFLQCGTQPDERDGTFPADLHLRLCCVPLIIFFVF
jgi:hypothetical protein